MAHNPPTHRRKLATTDKPPSISQKPQPQPKPLTNKQPKASNSSTSGSTIYNLSNQLSRLHPNPNPNPKPSDSHNPQKQILVQGKKGLSKSANLESKQGKRVVIESGGGGVVVELGSFMVKNSAKVVSADMPSFMQIHAVTFARNIKDRLEKFTSKNLAFSLKKEFDGVYGPAWHCIVGTSFGSFVTHSVAGFLYFSLDQKLYVLLFKTAVQTAD